MTEHPDTAGPLEVALDARAKGIVVIPCRPGTKVPLVKWKPWQEEMPPVELQREWFRDTRVNVAIITTGMVLFDVDDPALVELVLQHCGPTPHVVRTPRGGTHLGYRARKGVAVCNQVKIQGRQIDIRTNGGIEVIPPSVTDLGAYSGLPEGLRSVCDLPVAKVGWARERRRVRRRVQTQVISPDADFMLYRATRWLQTVEGAVSGQGGHNATFRVACKLTHYFGLDLETALRLMLTVFNPKCEPEWTEQELRHKCEDAIKKRT